MIELIVCSGMGEFAGHEADIICGVAVCYLRQCASGTFFSSTFFHSFVFLTPRALRSELVGSFLLSAYKR